MPNWTPTYRPDGEILTGDTYFADRQQAAEADVPAIQDDHSADLTQMQTVTDPAPAGTASLPTSLAGELERLRYAIRQIKQTFAPEIIDWYDSLQGLALPPGPPGGALLAAFWTYNATTTAPPAAGQIRSDSGLTTLWVHETDADGFTRITGLGSVAAGNTILVRAANGTRMDLQLTGPPVDSGVYWTLPVAVLTGTITKGARTQLNFVIAQTPASRVINTTAPLTGGGDLTADRTFAITDFTAGARGTVPASGGGTTHYLRADGTWAAPAAALMERLDHLERRLAALEARR